MSISNNLIPFTGGILIGSILTSLLINKIYKKQNSSQKQYNKKQINQQQFESSSYKQIKNEQLARIIKFFGEQKFQKLQKSSVIVFGVGGVGSHVVNMLARSGVGNIKIVDFDRVSLSSLNRHSFALRQDVGTSKVQCIKKYINMILPHVLIDIQEKYVTVQNAKQFFQNRNYDYVIDCIDNLDAKVQLIKICKQKNMKLIVSGGAGMKADPTKIQIRDISDVKYDSLTTRLKRQLTKHGIKNGVKVVFSYEQTTKQLLPLNQQQQKNPQSFKVFENYRIRIVPVLGTMPAIIGMSIASYVLCQLASQPYKPYETDYIKISILNRIYNQLINDQKKRGVNIKNIQVDMEEISILAKEVYDWKCLVTGKKQSNPRIIRWNPEKITAIENLVFLGKQAYQTHIKFNTLEKVQSYYSNQIKQRFNSKAEYALKLWKSGFKMFI